MRGPREYINCSFCAEIFLKESLGYWDTPLLGEIKCCKTCATEKLPLLILDSVAKPDNSIDEEFCKEVFKGVKRKFFAGVPNRIAQQNETLKARLSHAF